MSAPPERFDVFLAHHGDDKAAVEGLARRLKKAGIEPWLDVWRIAPGDNWAVGLADGIQASDSCAVFVGASALGAWERQEVFVALDRAAKEPEFRVFPVLLPGVVDPLDKDTLPTFLTTRSWVDLRGGVAGRRALETLINAVKGRPIGPEEPLAQNEGRPPYRGLRTFDEEDADLFFGRDAEIQDLLEKLKATRFVTVLGRSGSGKSSLVRAGLVSALRAGRIPGSDAWEIRTFTPGARPVEALAATVALLGDERNLGALIDQLMSDRRGLHLAVTLAAAQQPSMRRVLLIADQFEEVFTLCRDENERRSFFVNLVHAASVPGGRAIVVAAMREDFYFRCAEYDELKQLMGDHQLLVGAMGREELRQAVEAPAHRVGLELDDELTDAVLDDVGREPGALPLMEHALYEVWRRRRDRRLTLEGYRASGGVRGALARRADAIYESLDAEQQQLVRRMLLRLTQPGEGTEDTRRRAEIRELAARPDELDEVEEAVRGLVAARLLTTSGEGPNRWVEVSHEALIRGWPRLRDWVEKDREGLRIHHRLNEAAEEWRRLGDDGVLYRGARLEEAVEWRGRLELNPREREFLSESEALRDREARAAEALREKELRDARALAAARSRAQRLLGAVVGVLLAGVVASLVALAVARDRQQDAEAQAELALAGRLAAQSQALVAERLDLGLLLSLAALRREPTVEARASLVSGVLAQPGITKFLHGHTGTVAALAYRDGGNTLVATDSSGRTIRWDPGSGRRRGQAAELGKATAAAFAPAGDLLALGRPDGSIDLFDADRNRRITTLEPLQRDRHAVLHLMFAPDGRRLAAFAEDETDEGEERIVLWEVDKRRRAARQPPLTMRGPMAFSPDGRLLAAESSNLERIVIWEIGADVRKTFEIEAQVTTLAYSPDGRTLAADSSFEGVQLWHVRRGSPMRLLPVDTLTLRDVAFSPDGRLLAIDQTRGGITFESVSAAKPLGTPTRSRAGIAFDARGRALAAGGDGGSIVLWSANPAPRIAQRLRRSKLGFTAYPGDATVIRADELARPPRPTGRQRVPADMTQFAQVTRAPDRWTVAVADDGVLYLWDTERGRRIGAPLRPVGDDTQDMAFAAGGRLLASVELNDTATLWDVPSHRQLGQITGVDLLAGDLKGSSRRPLFVLTEFDERPVLWDLRSSSLEKVACSVANRNLTETEWEQYVGAESYERLCPMAPAVSPR